MKFHPVGVDFLNVDGDKEEHEANAPNIDFKTRGVKVWSGLTWLRLVFIFFEDYNKPFGNKNGGEILNQLSYDYFLLFLLGNSPASEFYVLTFGNTVPSIIGGTPTKMVHKFQTPRSWNKLFRNVGT